jgi:hypothetical protein
MGARGTIIVRRAMIKTGTYSGNGVDDRNINIGINLTSKNNPYVLVKAVDSIRNAIQRPEYAQGDLSFAYIAAAGAADNIQSFTATGFQIGTDVDVNEDTKTYFYVAFWEEP